MSNRRVITLSRTPGPDRFTSPANTPREAHLDLARHAVMEGWDESIIVVQDDITYPDTFPEHRCEITSYHRAQSPNHTCPRAFSATPLGWRRLARDWRRRGKTCELWTPDHHWDVTEHG